VLQSDVRLDLLVTDVGPPGGMNGPQVADAGRVARPGLKVLFITGYAENAVLGNGHLDPGMQVLIKPFAMEALASRIKEPAARTSRLRWRVLGRVSRLPLEFVRVLQAPIDQFI
jgi:DNA-binding LytR/AlgR family response regulator